MFAGTYQHNQSQPRLNYSDWEPWWKDNKDKTRADWVQDGFKEAGLPVHSPPDEQYIHALVVMMGKRNQGDKTWHLVYNALRLLKEAPSDMVRAQILDCATSANPEDRIGAIEALCSMRDSELKERLTNFCKDDCATVRTLALTRLNTYLRSVPEKAVADQEISKKRINGEIRHIGPGSDGRHVCITHVRRVEGKEKGRLDATYLLSLYNLDSMREEWEFLNDVEISSDPVLNGNYIFLCLEGGTVCCLRVSDGGLVWRSKPYSSCWGGGEKELVVKDNLVVLMHHEGLTALSKDTGETVWQFSVNAECTNWACAADRFLIATEDNEFVTVSSSGTELLRKKVDKPMVHVSFGNLVLTSTGDRTYAFAARDISTLEPAWQLPGIKGSYVRSLQTEDLLILVADNIYGIRKDSGEIIWSANNFNFYPLIILGGNILCADRNDLLEVHDAKTGELLTHYDAPVVDQQPVALAVDYLVVGSTNFFNKKENLWVLRMPPIKQGSE